MRPTYTTIYNEEELRKIVYRYCSSLLRNDLHYVASAWCMLPNTEVLIVDLDHNNRVVQVNKELALKEMARYLEEKK